MKSSDPWLVYLAAVIACVYGLVLLLIYVIESRYISGKSHFRMPSNVIELLHIWDFSESHVSSTRQRALLRARGAGTVFLVAGIAVILALHSYYRLLNISYDEWTEKYERGNYLIVEGVVSVKASDSSVDEIVSIGGVDFVVGESTPAVGYRTRSLKGGLLKDGEYVRVFYRDNIIMRIDLRKT